MCLYHPHQAPPASPLKGEALKCVNLARLHASPLRGEAVRRTDEGGIKFNFFYFINSK